MVFGSLRVGLTGLRANQRYLDVIGNNLVNSETVGFKSDRVTFSDLLYTTTRAPSGPSGSLGGVNARQFGFGVMIGSVDQNHAQGSLVSTGRSFDLALQGQGFFVVNNGSEDLYTRVGSLALDSAGNVVDSRTGFQMQNTSGTGITLDTTSLFPASATTSLKMGGILPAARTGPLAEVQESANAYEDHQPAVITGSGANVPAINAGDTLVLNVGISNPVTVTFAGTEATMADVVTAINTALTTANVTNVVPSDSGGELVLTSTEKGDKASISVGGTATSNLGVFGASAQGTATTAVGTTLINDFNSNTTDYVPGDIIRISGVDSNGATVNTSFLYGAANDGTTLDQLRAKVAGAYPNSTVSILNGKLNITANSTGENPMTLTLQDAPTNTGATNFSSQAFKTTTEGSGPDTQATSITVYDSLGLSHTLSGQFSRQDNGTWNLDLSIPAEDGVVTQSPITGISFGPDGSFQGSLGNTIDISFTNGASPTTIELDLGTVGGNDGLTQFSNVSSAQAKEQNGYAQGNLASIGVGSDGAIRGFYSNGENRVLDNVAIAVFQNAEGLVRTGDTLFRRSENSGEPAIGESGVGGAGGIVAGALEGSNVDTAEEFVRMIEAQRSFQGSARLVTTADEMFAELLQIV